MEQTVLTPAQEAILRLVASESRLAAFYLTGGTALTAYHLFHRISDDLDFFTADEPDTIFLEKFSETVKGALDAREVRFERVHDRRIFFFALPEGELKIEFTRYPFPQIEPPIVRDGMRVDGLRDLGANKLRALLDRFDPKDFVDLYFIFRMIPLKSVWRDAEQKFGMKIEPLFLGGELMKVRRVEALPKMLKPLAVPELKTFFIGEAKKLAPEVLRG